MCYQRTTHFRRKSNALPDLDQVQEAYLCRDPRVRLVLNEQYYLSRLRCHYLHVVTYMPEGLDAQVDSHKQS